MAKLVFVESASPSVKHSLQSLGLGCSELVKQMQNSFLCGAANRSTRVHFSVKSAHTKQPNFSYKIIYGVVKEWKVLLALALSLLQEQKSERAACTTINHDESLILHKFKRKTPAAREGFVYSSSRRVCKPVWRFCCLNYGGPSKPPHPKSKHLVCCTLTLWPSTFRCAAMNFSRPAAPMQAAALALNPPDVWKTNISAERPQSRLVNGIPRGIPAADSPSRSVQRIPHPRFLIYFGWTDRKFWRRPPLIFYDNSDPVPAFGACCYCSRYENCAWGNFAFLFTTRK
jgi:hypothetical protein